MGENTINGRKSGMPLAIAARAQDVTSNLLPEKSKNEYKKAYQQYLKWCGEQGIENICSEDALLVHFSEVSQAYKASSLWCYYSKIKANILIDHNVDISKFSRVIAFLKRKSEGYKAKKSKTLTREEVMLFLKNAENGVYLMVKVGIMMGIAGAMRCQELLNLSVDDIRDKGEVIIVNVRDTKTKIDRSFHIINPTDESSLDLLGLYREYASLRPPHTNRRRFFVFYKSGRCSTQPVGKNMLGKIPSTIATYLNLPDPNLYTGHCMRRTSATLLADSGANLTTVKRLGGWKSNSVAEGYIESSANCKSKLQIAKHILGENGNETSTRNVASSSNTIVGVTSTSAISGVVIHGTKSNNEFVVSVNNYKPQY